MNKIEKSVLNEVKEIFGKAFDEFCGSKQYAEIVSKSGHENELQRAIKAISEGEIKKGQRYRSSHRVKVSDFTVATRSGEVAIEFGVNFTAQKQTTDVGILNKMRSDLEKAKEAEINVPVAIGMLHHVNSHGKTSPEQIYGRRSQKDSKAIFQEVGRKLPSNAVVIGEYSNTRLKGVTIYSVAYAQI